MAILAGASAPHELVFDICIAGAGASGLALASDFASRHHRVGVLESGDMDATPSAAADGIVSDSGLAYGPLATSRLKGFGGSTRAHGWGGLCKPLDAADFEARTWVPNSGWPFGAEELAAHYARAAKTLGVSDPTCLTERPELFPDRSSVICADRMELAANARLGDALRGTIEKSRSVQVLTGLTLLQLEFDAYGRHIAGATCVDAGGRRMRIAATYFVLAAGGIENARILLVSNLLANRPEGLAGRFFMDHPRYTLGTVRPANGAFRSVFSGMDRIRIARKQRAERWMGSPVRRGPPVRGLTLSLQVQRQEKLLNHRAWVEPLFAGQSPDALAALKGSMLQYRDRIISGATGRDLMALVIGNANWTTAMHVARPHALARCFRLHHFLEPEPARESRVSLSPERDRFGLPLARLEWRLSPATLESFRRTIALFQKEFARSGIATLDVQPDEWEQLDRPMWTWHHMGTTRMDADSGSGVVDADCRVHGLDNLFVAGSSVFPTAGNDTPTMTIVALAHRLSGYLLGLLT